ncbi:MAG TPA: hypothetical protein VK498_07835 [Ferruginibacter sp.]|nr:hypothetical protein [Ferruginibacter sp.]
MNKIFLRLLCLIPALILCLFSIAQEKEPAMADTMRSNGKIYVVVAVCMIILLGLFLYAMTIDRKIKKLENEH